MAQPCYCAHTAPAKKPWTQKTVRCDEIEITGFYFSCCMIKFLKLLPTRDIAVFFTWVKLNKTYILVLVLEYDLFKIGNCL